MNIKKKKNFFMSFIDLFNFKNSDPINLTGRYDPVFLILIYALICFGLVMLFSASFARAHYFKGNSFHFISRQAVRALIGLIGMFIIAKIDYKKYKKLATTAYFIGIILLVAVLIIGKADENGIKRWIILGGPIRFQPSEIMKIALILMFSKIIAKNYKKMKYFKYGVLNFVVLLGIVIVLMLLEPHLSGTVLLCAIAGVMMFVGGTQVKWFVLVFSLALVALLYIMFFKGNYMSGRAYIWLNPFSDPTNQSLQTDQSLLAIGSGGIFGLGLGLSRQKFIYLPEVQNDFIFAVICEELGAVGAIAVIILFMCFCFKGFEIALKINDKFGSLLCVGIISQFVIQAIFNIAVVTSTIPNTGISLPFFSYGGTALVMQLWELGIVLNISRHSHTPKLLKIQPVNKPIYS